MEETLSALRSVEAYLNQISELKSRRLNRGYGEGAPKTRSTAISSPEGGYLTTTTTPGKTTEGEPFVLDCEMLRSSAEEPVLPRVEQLV